jgi:hypothetical protein
MALITQTELENKLGRSLTADEIANFAIMNVAVQSYVERMLGTSVETETPATRYYDGGLQNLEIDPCMAITAVGYVDAYNNPQYVLATNEYTIEPNTRAVKTMVRNRWGKFASGMNNVAITATFSIYDDPDTLAIVKNAMLDILDQVIENKESVTQESIEGYSVNYGSLNQTASMKALGTIIQGII